MGADQQSKYGKIQQRADNLDCDVANILGAFDPGVFGQTRKRKGPIQEPGGQACAPKGKHAGNIQIQFEELVQNRQYGGVDDKAAAADSSKAEQLFTACQVLRCHTFARCSVPPAQNSIGAGRRWNPG